MTADDRSFAPPHELVGPLGQTIDIGGGVTPMLMPPPVPGALATPSPGVTTAAPASTAAAGPGPLGALPGHDASLLTAIARLANELFGASPATSVTPVPLSPASALTPNNVQLPASPGISPELAASAPAGGATPVQVAAPGLHGGPTPQTAVAPQSAAAPQTAVAPQSTAAPQTALPLQSSFAPQSPFASAPFASSTSALRADALPTPAPSSDPGALSLADILRLPMLSEIAPDAAPYFVPPPDALGLDSSVGELTVPGPDSHAESALVRDLGGHAFDPYALRRDFPILEERVHGKRLVWLDNAATTQKPRAVIDRLSYFYEHENSNIHRAAHAMAARATDAYEGARESTRRFLHAGSTSEIVFVRGATEGINLVAQSWGRRYIAAGDEIVITHLEHHANIVPWQQLCQASGARLRVAPVDDRGDILLEAYERLLGPRTRLVALPQVSNALGTVTPARAMIEIAHRYGAVVLLDGAQAISHMPVDVQALDCDFYVLSGHKVFAPTGIGVVYGKGALLDATPPWQGGGNMIQDVTFERTTYQPPPGRFEAGTGSIADAVGLGAAFDYLTRIGMERIERYEHDLRTYADRQLATVPGLHMIGAPREKAGVLSFVLDGVRTEDVGTALDQEGIAVRSGHHCAQPILRRFGVEASVRASLAFYNVCEDIDALVSALHRLVGGRGVYPG